MKYRSTRSDLGDFTFEDCVLKGLASDGGLLLPNNFPDVNMTTLKSWIGLPYQNVIYEIAKLYVDDDEIPHLNLKELINRAFLGFSLSEIIQIVDGAVPSLLDQNELRVAELFHGPTLAFKDLSVACFASFLEYFLNKCNKKAIIIVATSGDTGGSVIQAFKGTDSVDVVVMYPKGRCNEVQELQMITAADKNIHCFAVEGTSDDEDLVMTAVLKDERFSNCHNLTVANSINWARMLVQVATYFYVYLNCGIEMSQTLSIIVPTGGAGNITAGCIARQMGLPIVFTLAVNANDCLHRFLRDGVLKTSGQVTHTLASSMDIQVPYNVERLLSIYKCDEAITTLIKDFFADGHEVKIPNNILKKLKEVIVASYCADDNKILETMSRCWRENQYAICPHTATALACFYERGHLIQSHDGNRMTVCIATASPNKFPEALQAAGIPLEDASLLLKELKRRTICKPDIMLKGEDWVNKLRHKIEMITESRKKKTTI